MFTAEPRRARTCEGERTPRPKSLFDKAVTTGQLSDVGGAKPRCGLIGFEDRLRRDADDDHSSGEHRSSRDTLLHIGPVNGTLRDGITTRDASYVHARSRRGLRARSSGKTEGALRDPEHPLVRSSCVL